MPELPTSRETQQQSITLTDCLRYIYSDPVRTIFTFAEVPEEFVHRWESMRATFPERYSLDQLASDTATSIPLENRNILLDTLSFIEECLNAMMSIRNTAARSLDMEKALHSQDQSLEKHTQKLEKVAETIESNRQIIASFKQWLVQGTK